MTYTFLDYTIAITTAGIFQVKSRKQGTVAQSIDLNQHKALYESTSTGFVIGAGDEEDMGVVNQAVPLSANQITLSTAGEICNGSNCIQAHNVSILGQLVMVNNVQTLQFGSPVAEPV